MDWSIVWQALLRKLLFVVMLLLVYVFADKSLLRGFDTAKEIAHDPKAIAILLGSICIAAALS